MPFWALWTNVLVLPTIGIAFSLALFEAIGGWSLIIGFIGVVFGMVVLREKSAKYESPLSA